MPPSFTAGMHCNSFILSRVLSPCYSGGGDQDSRKASNTVPNATKNLKGLKGSSSGSARHELELSKEDAFFGLLSSTKKKDVDKQKCESGQREGDYFLFSRACVELSYANKCERRKSRASHQMRQREREREEETSEMCVRTTPSAKASADGNKKRGKD